MHCTCNFVLQLDTRNNAILFFLSIWCQIRSIWITKVLEGDKHLILFHAFVLFNNIFNYTCVFPFLKKSYLRYIKIISWRVIYVWNLNFCNYQWLWKSRLCTYKTTATFTVIFFHNLNDFNRSVLAFIYGWVPRTFFLMKGTRKELISTSVTNQDRMNT